MIQKSSIEKTLGLFFQYPLYEYSIQEISRQVGIAHTSIRKNLLSLQKNGLIEKRIEKRGKRKFPLYKAKRGKYFLEHKKIFNLQEILESGLIDYIQRNCTPKCIVLFGSYSRGEDLEESDIDIFIESKQEKLALGKFERYLGRKIDVHWKEQFDSYPSELKNNIINGISLWGFLEGFT